MDTVEDAAERALDLYDEQRRDAKKVPGEHRYVTAVTVDDTPLEGGLARETFLRYAAAQADPEQSDDGLGNLIERVRPREGYDASEYGEYRPNGESAA